MTHRTDRVYLAPSEPRCDPTRKVDKCPTCARLLAPIPPMGIVRDYSLSISIFAPWCPNYLSSQVKREAEPVRKEVKPWPVE